MYTLIYSDITNCTVQPHFITTASYVLGTDQISMREVSVDNYYI
jgi:hypothetical protein